MSVALSAAGGLQVESERAGPEAPYGPTEERILSAALRLLGRRGVKRLGMQEVSEVAGVSRGTLYRYFPSKDHLLEAVAGYDERRFSAGMAEALAAVHGPTERIRTVVAFAFDYIRTHPARSLFESEPDFVLGYLLTHLAKLEEALLEQLGDAFDTLPVVAAGALSRAQLADVIVRLFTSSFIIPETDDRTLVQSILGLLLPPDPIP
ncbi:MAG TPA: helix-turn-helix domain-containing protein [Acidimicrobiales bacterium]|nr:helix-turn-helix domain-containing protein [Acidimicrobiales bacterium]